MNNDFLNRATKLIIDIMFFCGIICTVLVPFAAKPIGVFCGYDIHDSIIFAAMLFLSGAASVYILFNLRLMLKTLIGNNPFVIKNAECLRCIAAACLIITLIYLVKCILMFSWASVVIALVFMIGALFCLVLKDLFKQAVAYKEENDWTV